MALTVQNSYVYADNGYLVRPTHRCNFEWPRTTDVYKKIDIRASNELEWLAKFLVSKQIDSATYFHTLSALLWKYYK